MEWFAIFFICFGVGAGFVVITVFLGEVIGMLDASFGTGTAPFRPILVALFLTVFGGLGMLLSQILEDWFAAGVAALGGIAIAYILYRHVIVRMLRWQSTTVHEKQSLIGHTAKAVETIPQGGYGKITYTINDKIVSGPAKSESGEEIKRNEMVEIVYIEKNTYYVKKKL
jgi:membrane protein implicated in regulation of membrane protease activity